MSIEGRDVTVVGAGIGGAAAALLLARAGAAVTLLERRADPAPAGAGILLHPNGLAVLTGLGLGERLHRAGRVLRDTVVLAGGPTPVMTVASPDFGAGLDHLLAVRRSDLHAALSAAVGAEASVDRRYGAEVTSVDQTGSVELAWRGRTVTLTADLVVGADGVHSVVRRAGEFGASDPAPGHRYLRGLVPHPDGVRLVGEHWTALGVFGGAPVDADTLYFYAAAGSAPVAEALAAADLPALRRAWARVLPSAGPILDTVTNVDQLLVNDVLRVDCRRWHDGRTVLLGDAAHAMAPTLGQGANSALVDAAILVAELTGQNRLYPALERYTRRRRPAVTRVQNRADTLTRIAAVPSPALRGVRNALLRGLGRFPGAGARMVRDAQQEDPAALLRLVRMLDRRGPAPLAGAG